MAAKSNLCKISVKLRPKQNRRLQTKLQSTNYGRYLQRAPSTKVDESKKVKLTPQNVNSLQHHSITQNPIFFILQLFQLSFNHVRLSKWGYKLFDWWYRKSRGRKEFKMPQEGIEVSSKVFAIFIF